MSEQDVRLRVPDRGPVRRRADDCVRNFRQQFNSRAFYRFVQYGWSRVL